LKRLGELNTVQWPDLPAIEEISGEIKTLEEKGYSLKGEWHRIYKTAGRLETGKNQATILKGSGQ